jgi:hypothetical protein
MCKEIPVIPANRVVDKKRIHYPKKWRAEEEVERHKRALSHSCDVIILSLICKNNLEEFFCELFK